MRGEELSLEILISALQTNKPLQTLEEVIDELERKGNRKLADKFSLARDYISAGEDITDAFFFSGLISEETYHYFSVYSKEGSLSPEVVKDYLSLKRDIKNVISSTVSSLAYPVMSVLGAVAGSVILIRQFTRIYLETVGEKPFFFAIYEFIMNYPLIGGTVMFATVMLILLTSIYFLMKALVGKEMWLMKLSNLLKSLRMQKVPYHRIFEFLYEREKNKKIRELYEELILITERQHIAEAYPLFEHIPLNLAVILREKLRIGEEVSAWETLAREMKERIFFKLSTLSSLSPVFAYLLIFIIFAFAFVPFFLTMSHLLSQI